MSRAAASRAAHAVTKAERGSGLVSLPALGCGHCTPCFAPHLHHHFATSSLQSKAVFLLLHPQDPDLREAAALLQRALNAPSVQEEEALWTRVIDTYGGMDRPWVPDVVSTVLGVTCAGGRGMPCRHVSSTRTAAWTTGTYGLLMGTGRGEHRRHWRLLWRHRSCVHVWLGNRLPCRRGMTQASWRWVPCVCMRPPSRRHARLALHAHLAGTLGSCALHTKQHPPHACAAVWPKLAGRRVTMPCAHSPTSAPPALLLSPAPLPSQPPPPLPPFPPGCRALDDRTRRT